MSRYRAQLLDCAAVDALSGRESPLIRSRQECRDCSDGPRRSRMRDTRGVDAVVFGGVQRPCGLLRIRFALCSPRRVAAHARDLGRTDVTRPRSRRGLHAVSGAAASPADGRRSVQLSGEPGAVCGGGVCDRRVRVVSGGSSTMSVTRWCPLDVGYATARFVRALPLATFSWARRCRC